ncbi:MAG: primosomal protein N' [Gammaproteobacteria bacterium]
MKNTLFLEIAIPCPLRKTFDYLLPEELSKTLPPLGSRVRVPFGRRELIGIVVRHKNSTESPKEKIKSVLEIFEEQTLTPDIFHLCQWAADYYHHPLGEVMHAAMPKRLRVGKEASAEKALAKTTKMDITKRVTLNAQQQQAVDAISQSLDQYQPFLLYGITGSGKTEVYFHCIEAVLKQEKQVLVLIPEISLTPQTIRRFEARFDVPIVNLHSGLNDTERLRGWVMAKQNHAKIVIGTRSAIFTPLDELGLIVIDEEHDASFKQQTGFRYHARDLALVRARDKIVPVILGSATPSLESFYNAKQGRYQLLTLTERAGNARAPKMQLLDASDLSDDLCQTIKAHLDKDQQVLVFNNRRGYAPVLFCQSCRWMAVCKRCDAKMVHHKGSQRIVCHHCDSHQPLPEICPECSSTSLASLGAGTERLEETLAKRFPDVEIIRIDRDTTRKKGAMQAMLKRIREGKRQILIGTQMLAKGHHFPNVTLAIIMNIDGGLMSPDFRAPERVAQLIVQVAGRAGRAERPGDVFIQTVQPEHPLLQTLLKNGYADFANKLLIERQQSLMPPYQYLSLIRAEAKDNKKPMQFLSELKSMCARDRHDSLMVLGPTHAPMQKKAGHFRAQLLLQAEERKTLMKLLRRCIPELEALKLGKQVRWSIDVDPVDLF